MALYHVPGSLVGVYQMWAGLMVWAGLRECPNLRQMSNKGEFGSST